MSPQETYLGYVRDVAENWLGWDRLEPITESYRNMIRDVVAGDNRKLYSMQGFESGVEQNLRPFIEARQSYLLDWLDNAGIQ